MLIIVVTSTIYSASPEIADLIGMWYAEQYYTANPDVGLSRPVFKDLISVKKRGI